MLTNFNRLLRDGISSSWHDAMAESTAGSDSMLIVADWLQKKAVLHQGQPAKRSRRTRKCCCRPRAVADAPTGDLVSLHVVFVAPFF